MEHFLYPQVPGAKRSRQEGVTLQIDANGDGTFERTITSDATLQPPVAEANGPYEENESSPITFDASVSYDPDGGALQYRWDFDNDGIWDTEWSDSLTASHTWDDDWVGSVSVEVSDGAFTDIATADVVVQNVAPTADLATSWTINEGEVATLAFSNPFDPSELDTAAGFQYSYDCTDDGTFELGDGSAASFACDYPDNGIFTARGQIKDKNGGFTDYTVEVTVDNVAPTVGAVTAPVDPAQVNTVIDTSADFTDPGVLDTHTAVWGWGDYSTSEGIVTESNGSGSVSGSHTYATAGVYRITLTVTDDDDGSDSSVFEYVVVYDPDGGFVTGGGWIDSPEGAYALDPTLTGKANFGFVSKYKKGATVPTGQTQFQFRVADLNFHSDSYDWLVIAGAKAMYKGVGTINGEGEYKFMLTAIDGDINTNDALEVDQFRIKIWSEDAEGNETVVYDNALGDDGTTAIGGGSIVVHKK